MKATPLSELYIPGQEPLELYPPKFQRKWTRKVLEGILGGRLSVCRSDNHFLGTYSVIGLAEITGHESFNAFASHVVGFRCVGKVMLVPNELLALDD